MVFAWGAKQQHEFAKPALPQYNDTVGYSSKWLMDDGVIVEAEVGIRTWLSAKHLNGRFAKPSVTRPSMKISGRKKGSGVIVICFGDFTWMFRR